MHTFTRMFCCYILLFAASGGTGQCQNPEPELEITVKDVPLSTGDFVQKLRLAKAVEEKALVARLYFTNLPSSKLKTIILDKNSSTEIKWLAAWEQLSRHGHYQMMRDNSTRIKFAKDDLNEFLGVLELDTKIPEGWRKLLSTGDYLESGWFVSFARSEVPKAQFDEIKLTVTKNNVLIDFGSESWRIGSDRLAGMSFLGGKITNKSILLLLEDEQEAWAYYCAKVDQKGVQWLTKVQSYWLFPEGGNFYVEPTVAGDKIFVFCALPTSVAINCLDSISGEMLATFSSTWVDLSYVDVHNKEVGTNPATPPKNE